MERLSEPRIRCVDKLPNAVFIMFGDGKCAIYSASLLYEMLPQAQQVAQDDELESDE
jgi:hypothetical protein